MELFFTANFKIMTTKNFPYNNLWIFIIGGQVYDKIHDNTNDVKTTLVCATLCMFKYQNFWQFCTFQRVTHFCIYLEQVDSVFYLLYFYEEFIHFLNKFLFFSGIINIWLVIFLGQEEQGRMMNFFNNDIKIANKKYYLLNRRWVKII